MEVERGDALIAAEAGSVTLAVAIAVVVAGVSEQTVERLKGTRTKLSEQAFFDPLEFSFLQAIVFLRSIASLPPPFFLLLLFPTQSAIKNHDSSHNIMGVEGLRHFLQNNAKLNKTSQRLNRLTIPIVMIVIRVGAPISIFCCVFLYQGKNNLDCKHSCFYGHLNVPIIFPKYFSAFLTSKLKFLSPCNHGTPQDRDSSNHRRTPATGSLSFALEENVIFMGLFLLFDVYF